jgi:hypothetical protein
MATVVLAVACEGGGRGRVGRGSKKHVTEGGSQIPCQGLTSKLGKDETSHHHSSLGWPRDTDGGVRGDEGLDYN